MPDIIKDYKGAERKEEIKYIRKKVNKLTGKFDSTKELDAELMSALEASLAGTGLKASWVFDHIIAVVRKYNKE